ncbi:MAG TPA: rRNA large subunit methyltransferase I, partial [Nitrospira sp.]|nr:rRNA large subunit methyltransferase I [Nitrospira sp.]
MTQLVTGSTGKVLLTAERDQPRYYGHLWVFDTNVADVLGTPAPGDLVDVYTYRKRFLGRGLFNPHSKIRVRLLTFQEEPVDEAFFAARLRAAATLRRTVTPHANACRLVHGESDLLPGLVVDRFADVAVMQTLGYG